MPCDESSAANRPRRFCLNCNNQHGCRSAESPCQEWARAPAERFLSGKTLMAKHGQLARCAGCAFFRRCFTEEEYKEALGESMSDKKSS